MYTGAQFSVFLKAKSPCLFLIDDEPIANEKENYTSDLHSSLKKLLLSSVCVVREVQSHVLNSFYKTNFMVEEDWSFIWITRATHLLIRRRTWTWNGKYKLYFPFQVHFRLFILKMFSIRVKLTRLNLHFLHAGIKKQFRRYQAGLPFNGISTTAEDNEKYIRYLRLIFFLSFGVANIYLLAKVNLDCEYYLVITQRRIYNSSLFNDQIIFNHTVQVDLLSLWKQSLFH